MYQWNTRNRMSSVLPTRGPLTPLERLTHHAEQVQDQHNEQDRSEDSKAAACSPPGISVIAATAAEQQNQNDD
jgi:hypothetical protein